MSFVEALELRFPNTEIEVLESGEKLDIIRFPIVHLEKKFFVISTAGLWKYTMPVSHKYEGSNHIELCFCVNEDWDFEAEGYNWVVEKLKWLATYMLERETWFGVGHTIPNGKPAEIISKAFQQEYFYFDETTYLKDEMKPIVVEDITVHFLFILPISRPELDYKMKKTTFGFQKRLKKKGITEILEDFRVDVADKSWKLW